MRISTRERLQSAKAGQAADRYKGGGLHCWDIPVKHLSGQGFAAAARVRFASFTA
jgi:hypothetical protein